MHTALLASASIAIAMAVTLFDPAPAEAGQRRMLSGKASRVTIQKRPRVQLRRQAKPRLVIKKKPKLVIKKKPLATSLAKKKVLTKSLVKKGGIPLVKKGAGGLALSKTGGGHFKFGKANIGKLPISKAVAGTAALRGRIALPRNLAPKLTLTKVPKAHFQHRMSPFVQRHWKKAFIWVAVAGIGYLTVPEIYYDRFLGFVHIEDYDSCIRLLSYAALEEEEEIVRVRRPMPANSVYRYSAKVAPEEVKSVSDSSCSFDPFIERNWSRPFVWVQIPKIGNVTVPEDYYDRFYGFVSAQPENYPAACAVLVEAAALDTVATTSLDFQRTNVH